MEQTFVIYLKTLDMENWIFQSFTSLKYLIVEQMNGSWEPYQSP